MNAKTGALTLGLILTVTTSLAFADGDRDEHHDRGGHHFPPVGLVKTVLDYVAPFESFSYATQSMGYVQGTGCVSGPNGGAMGVHYVNVALLTDDEIDPTKPEILVYEPTPSGSMRLVAAEYVVFKEAWEAKHGVGNVPYIEGQHMMFTTAPNRYALPDHYELHVWAFKDNPAGMFAPWNPKVTCEYYAPEQ